MRNGWQDSEVMFWFFIAGSHVHRFWSSSSLFEGEFLISCLTMPDVIFFRRFREELADLKWLFCISGMGEKWLQHC